MGSLVGESLSRFTSAVLRLVFVFGFDLLTWCLRWDSLVIGFILSILASSLLFLGQLTIFASELQRVMG